MLRGTKAESRSDVGLVLSAFLLVPVVSACHPCSRVAWEIALTDCEGVLSILRVSPSEVFSIDGSIGRRVVTCATKFPCYGGWVDAASGLMSTVEDEKEKTTVRVYDSKMRVIGEEPMQGRHGSVPVLSPGGKRLAFVNSQGAVFLGQMPPEGGVRIRQVCQLKAGCDVRSTLVWVDGGTVAFDYLGDIYRADIDSAGWIGLGIADLLGAQRGALIVTPPGGPDSPLARSLAGVYVGEMDLQGHVTPLRGMRVRTAILESGYPGNRVHRISPDGQFLAYDTRILGRRDPFLAFMHLPSGRKAHLRCPNGIRSMGSWNEVRPTASQATAVPFVTVPYHNGRTVCRN